MCANEQLYASNKSASFGTCLYRHLLFSAHVGTTALFSFSVDVLSVSVFIGSKPIVKRNRPTFCRTRSLSNATFSFLITSRSSSSKSAAVYKISSKSDDFFTEIWRYIYFQNGGRPPSWNCFSTISDHPRSLCCWLQLPVKFHVNLIHRSEDIAIWIFSIIIFRPLFEFLFRPQNWGFGDFGPLNMIIHHRDHRDPQKTSLCKSASFKLSTVKIRWGVWPVGGLTESVTDTHTHR